MATSDDEQRFLVEVTPEEAAVIEAMRESEVAHEGIFQYARAFND